MALIRYLLVLMAVAGIVAVLHNEKSRLQFESKFTHEEVEKINPYFILDTFTLMSEDNAVSETKAMFDRLTREGYLLPTPYGLVVLPEAKGVKIPVIIQSPGGMVDIGNKLKGFFKYLRSNGLYIECHVSEAQSMAFNVMLTVCSKVIAKKDVLLMQHRFKYGDLGTTPATYREDILMSKEEAQVLGINYKDWNNLVRGSKDHVFTLKEIEKYKLVDEWVD